MVNIVSVIVEQESAPPPDTLQKTGFLISQGGTTTSPGTKTLLTQLADLTPFLSAALAIAFPSGLVWSGSVVTVTTAAPHGFTVADTLLITIAGAAPSGYNGTFGCTVTGASTFTYPLASNPGSQTVAGTYIVANESQLLQMATTFFAQGSNVPVFVLELGPGNVNDGVAFLTDWLTANPGNVYDILVPRQWDANTAYLALVAANSGDTAKLYFYTTTTLATYGVYPTTSKAAPILIESPAYGMWPANALATISFNTGIVTATTTTAHGVAPGQWFQISGVTPSGYNGWHQAITGTTGSTLLYLLPADPGSETVLGTLIASFYSNPGIAANEFTMAAPFWQALSADPGPGSRVPPMNLRYLIGVTPYPLQGNAAELATLKAANVWTAQNGAPGNVNANILVGGNMLDSNPWNYWYGADWAQINVVADITAAVIAGSNNTINPLYLNQDGINLLQGVGAGTLSEGVAGGLFLGAVVETELTTVGLANALQQGQFFGNAVINAVPFAVYYGPGGTPSDYALGKYAGFTVLITPLRGFDSIVFTLVVFNFPVP